MAISEGEAMQYVNTLNITGIEILTQNYSLDGF